MRLCQDPVQRLDKHRQILIRDSQEAVFAGEWMPNLGQGRSCFVFKMNLRGLGVGKMGQGPQKVQIPRDKKKLMGIECIAW